MVVDVLKQMRERLDMDSFQQDLAEKNRLSLQAAQTGQPGQTGANGPDEKTGEAGQATRTQATGTKVYAYQTPIPDDLWLRCPSCNGVMFREDYEKAHNVCTLCGHHYRLDSRDRLAQICDEGTFEEQDADMTSLNPIDFSGYDEKQQKLRAETGLKDAVITGLGRINGQACLIGIMDGRYLMGSMGSVVGEKITRLFEKGIELQLPVITFAASGGARMQEGIVSLMQMAKTAAAVGKYHEAGLLYLSVLTDPTTGGVTASFASLGDIILSEPGTLIGFAGRRVIEGTIAQALPEGFQRAEFLLEHGFLDLIVPRSRLKQTLSALLSLHAPDQSTVAVSALSVGLTHRAPGAVVTAVQAPGAVVTAVQAAVTMVPSENRRSGSERLDIIRQKNRPVISDYLPIVFDDVIEMHGDRLFKDDAAMWGGLGRLNGCPVTIVGHRRGRTIDENSRTNFGMPHPEGYRKAMRLMKQAEKFRRPIICLVDTSGAYCGIGAEERGQGEAIARSLMESMSIRVPILVVIMGEGGSGGALAIGVGDELAMLSNALYSVISPRGFASLLWKDPSREREAADILKITAEDLSRLGICDAIVPEPAAGAHTNLSQTAEALKSYLGAALIRQMEKSTACRLTERYDKFRRIGSFSEN